MTYMPNDFPTAKPDMSISDNSEQGFQHQAEQTLHAIFAGAMVKRDLDGKTVPVDVGHVKFHEIDRYGDPAFEVEVSIPDALEKGVGPSVDALLHQVKAIPVFAEHFNIQDNHASAKELKRQLAEMMGRHPDRFPEVLRQRYENWQGLGDSPRTWERNPTTGQNEKNAVTLDLRLPEKSNNLGGIADDAMVTENITNRKANILQAIKEQLDALNQEHVAKDGVPLFNAEEIKQLQNLDIETKDYRSDDFKNVRMTFGTPAEADYNGKDAGKDDDDLHETPMHKLSGEVLNPIIVNAVLYAGQGAEQIFPLVAGPKQVRAELQKAFEGTGEDIDALLGNPLFSDGNDKSEKPVVKYHRNENDHAFISFELNDGITSADLMKGIVEAGQHLMPSTSENIAAPDPVHLEHVKNVGRLLAKSTEQLKP